MPTGMKLDDMKYKLNESEEKLMGLKSLNA